MKKVVKKAVKKKTVKKSGVKKSVVKKKTVSKKTIKIISKNTKSELLAPAGSWPALRAALKAGANAIYFGLKKFNMRAKASNFEVSELKKVVSTIHKAKAKAYLALNTIVFEPEIKALKKLMKEVKAAGVDAVIGWDYAVLNEAKANGIPVHLSTQASVSNSEAAKFFKTQGVNRIILARECSIEQIKDIKKNAGVEVEVFVHGAMCVSLSGRCFLSHELFGKSANRGECIQPCRREFTIVDKEEKHQLKVGSDYVMSPKDLCALPFIKKLQEIGVDSFKIEGRNRSPEYVKTVTEVYRKAIDAKKLDDKTIQKLIEKLGTVYNRGFSSGFYVGMPTGKDFTNEYGSIATTRKEYIGGVRNFYKKVGVMEVILESGIVKKGDTLLIQGNKTGVLEETVTSIEVDRKKARVAKKGMAAGFQIKGEVRPHDKVFKVVKAEDRHRQ